MKFKNLGFSGQKMCYPLNSMFGMVVGEQNTGKSYLFQSNPDAFIINLDLSSTVVPECKATVWPGINDNGRPMDVDDSSIVLTWDKVLEKKAQLIEMAKSNSDRPSCVVIDTISPLIRLLQPWVAERMGRETFNDAHGQAAWGMLYDEILNFASDLRQHGYGVWLIAHLSNKYFRTNEEETRRELELALTPGLISRITPMVEMIAPVCAEQKIETQQVKKQVKTPSGKTVERTIPKSETVYIRKIAFEDSRFNHLIRTRTVNRMQDVILDSVDPWKSFETAFNAANSDLTKEKA